MVSEQGECQAVVHEAERPRAAVHQRPPPPGRRGCPPTAATAAAASPTAAGHIPRWFLFLPATASGPSPSAAARACAVHTPWIPAAATPQLFPPTRPGRRGLGEAV